MKRFTFNYIRVKDIDEAHNSIWYLVGHTWVEKETNIQCLYI